MFLNKIKEKTTYISFFDKITWRNIYFLFLESNIIIKMIYVNCCKYYYYTNAQY